MEHLLDALLIAFIPAAAVLLAAALYCLLPGRVTCKRKTRRALGWVLALFLAVSRLQLAGEFTLAMFGLAWRAWVRSLFAGALGLLTFLGVFQILGCYLEQRDTLQLAHQIVVGISGLVVIAYLVTVGLPSWFLALRPERTVAWRAWLVSFLQGAALVLVVVWTLLVGLSVLCRDEAYSVVRKIILGVSICVVIGSAVTEGLFFWTFSTVEERVVASQDRTLVEEDRGFLDPFYVYYEYHGPLVRGMRSVDVGVPYGECLQEDE